MENRWSDAIDFSLTRELPNSRAGGGCRAVKEVEMQYAGTVLFPTTIKLVPVVGLQREPRDRQSPATASTPVSMARRGCAHEVLERKRTFTGTQAAKRRTEPFEIGTDCDCTTRICVFLSGYEKGQDSKGRLGGYPKDLQGIRRRTIGPLDRRSAMPMVVALGHDQGRSSIPGCQPLWLVWSSVVRH